ncbi:hypothetical protein C8R45DRAFT_1178080 [Mycena sanguinolenta]|nr:hypothetical protein C8R45DRAFT_1178080 [Mycena sanguinolenta]
MAAGEEKTIAELSDRFEAVEIEPPQASGGKKQKRLPDKHTDRAAWNAHYEREIAEEYAWFFRNLESSKPKILKKQSDEHFLGFKGYDIKMVNQEIALIMTELVRTEQTLANLSLEKLENCTFEADWAALDQMKKNELVLEGLYRGACGAPQENSRIDCPEMTVNGLAGDGDYSLIHLLRRLVEHYTTGRYLEEPVFLFTHPYKDFGAEAWKRTDFDGAFTYLVTLYRTCYISETLRGTLQAFYDMPPAPLTRMNLFSRTLTSAMVVSEDTPSYGAAFRYLGVPRTEKAQLEYACYTCKCVKDRDELKRCGKCLSVRYCSGECQKKDWSHHKKFCGATHFEPALLMPPPLPRPEFIGCPSAIKCYVRSKALWQQIEWLSKPDSLLQDYHFEIAPNRTRSVRILDPPGGQLIFFVARRRAIALGDLSAVNTMLSILHCMRLRGQLNLTSQQIVSQFEKEYGVEIRSGVGVVGAGEYSLSTEQEKDEEREFHRQRLAAASYSDPNVVRDVFSPPTRAEIEEELTYQNGPLPQWMFEGG